VIVVDADVDPFDLWQVMWTMSVKINPAGDLLVLPNLSENLLDPACQPGGMVSKTTTPIGLDNRGDYGQELDTPQTTNAWRQKFAALIKPPDAR
jgi:3-polyprenyl-4-hydroxybenzoate decarboxylase